MIKDARGYDKDLADQKHVTMGSQHTRRCRETSAQVPRYLRVRDEPGIM